MATGRWKEKVRRERSCESRARGLQVKESAARSNKGSVWKISRRSSEGRVVRFRPVELEDLVEVGSRI